MVVSKNEEAELNREWNDKQRVTTTALTWGIEDGKYYNTSIYTGTC